MPGKRADSKATEPARARRPRHLPEGETFIGEPIEPAPGSFDTAAMARGGPGVPRRFLWRGREHRVAGVIEAWRSKDPGHGMDREYEYTRRHFFRIRTTAGEAMTIYFDHKPPSGRGKRHQRWHLFSIALEGRRGEGTQ